MEDQKYWGLQPPTPVVVASLEIAAALKRLARTGTVMP